MRFLIAADLAPNKIGSLERQLFLVGCKLEGLGHEVRYAFSGEITPEVLAHFALDPSTITPNLGALPETERHPDWLRELRAHKPDVLWLHFFPLWGSLARGVRAACPGARIVLTERVSRGFVKRSLPKQLYCRARALLHRHCIDEYIAISRFVAQRLQEVDHVPSERIRTVYNGIDTESFRPAEGGAVDAGYVAAVLHMRPEKGLPVLLEALKLLKAQGLEPEVRLCGEGPNLGQFQEFCAREGLDGVRFLGRRDDVNEVLRGAAVAVVPSLWPEAFGNACVEAMASGVPVVASRIGGLPELVEPGATGLLVPPGDAAALAEALASLLREPERRREMGRAARERAVRLFRLEDRAEEITRILIGQHGP